MAATRTRDDVLADIADYTHAATRLVCVDPDYELTHMIINDLLEELERM